MKTTEQYQIVDRKSVLESMPYKPLMALAKDYDLPRDLNRTETIKYILEKEFPSR